MGLLSADSAQAELWKGNSIVVAQELPELLEPETDLYEASQRLKETKQRFWEKRKGGGRGGEKGGKGKGKDGGISDAIYDFLKICIDLCFSLVSSIFERVSGCLGGELGGGR